MRKFGSLMLTFLFFGVLLTGCEKKPVVENEKYVSLHYKGTLSDGSEFDSSEGGEPLGFIYGAGMMIPGFEKGISGMRAGEKKTIYVKAEDAYGPYQEDLVGPVPREEFPPDFVPEIGMRFMVQTMYGPMPVRIKDMTEAEIFIDYNTPLAGEDLTFEIEILEIRNPTGEELESLRQAQRKVQSSSGTLPPIPEN
jgi:peptidylprolyl isomerase